MLNAIIGDVVFTNGQTVVLRSFGLEFTVNVSSQTGYRISGLGSEERKNIRILTYLKHSEEEIVLFGFSEEEERQLFLELVKVPGIGPKQAMKILSGASVSEIIRALDQNDIKFLSKIPGLGSKTAQKIVLALRDKLVLLETDTPSSDAVAASKRFEDLIVALAEMGYDKKKVAQTVSDLEKANADALSGKNLHEQEELLFRLALSSL